MYRCLCCGGRNFPRVSHVCKTGVRGPVNESPALQVRAGVRRPFTSRQVVELKKPHSAARTLTRSPDSALVASSPWTPLPSPTSTSSCLTFPARSTRRPSFPATSIWSVLPYQLLSSNSLLNIDTLCGRCDVQSLVMIILSHLQHRAIIEKFLHLLLSID